MDWRYSRPCDWDSQVSRLKQSWRCRYRHPKKQNPYIRGGRVSLEVGLDATVLLVEECQVRNEILDDIGVGQWVDHALFRLLGNAAKASQSVGSVDVHGTGTANTLTARSPKGQCRVHFVLDPDEGVEHHRTRLVEIEGVRLHLRFDRRSVGIPPINLKRLEMGVRRRVRLLRKRLRGLRCKTTPG